MLNSKEISEQLLKNLPELIQTLQLDELYETTSRYTGACPIHDGADNISAFNIDKKGIWACYSHNCHKVFKNSIIGLIRGLLSKHYMGWKQYGDPLYSYPETLKWCNNLINGHSFLLKPTIKTPSIKIQTIKNKLNFPRHIVKNILQIPAPFYLQKGYSSHILKRYDVGVCKSKNKYFSNRVVIPLYNETLDYAIGFTGRTIWDICTNCKMYHNPKISCPDTPLKKMSCYKWKHSKNFPRETYLFNLYNNLSYIKQQKSIILVESPGNVLRLEDAGIKNSVAILGTIMNDGQIELLDKYGIRHVSILMDNDIAGKQAAQIIYDKISNYYQTKILSIPYNVNDVGNLNTEQILNFLGG